MEEQAVSKVDLIKELQALSSERKDIYVPSIKKNVQVKTLTLKQQKDIIKLAADNVTSIISLHIILYSIFKENIIGTNIETLLVTDRSSICVAMRNLFISSNIKVNKDNGVAEIDLIPLITNTPNIQCNVPDEEINIKNFVFHVSTPTLLVDNEFNKHIKNKFKDITSKNDVKEMFGDLYVNELGKFINSITIKKDEGDTVIQLKALPITKRIEVLESIPTEIYSSVVDFTKKVRDVEKNLLTTEGHTVDISVALFTP